MADKDTIFMEELEGQGYENIHGEDLTTPFLKILQALSPELDKEEDSYVKGAEAGMFINSLNNKLYGREIDLIPLHFEKVWLEWRPNRGGLVARHEPYSIQVDKTNFSSWKYGENEVSETLMFYCLVAGHLEDGPIIFALSSSGIKHGKNWNTQIMMTKLPSGKRAPYFSSVWHLKTTKQSNDQGTWYQIGGKKSNIERVRFITSDEYQNFISPIRADLEKLSSNVDFKQIEAGKQIEEKVDY